MAVRVTRLNKGQVIEMIGKIFITSSGYDPQLGKHVKDPYLGSPPSLGACRPDIRRMLRKGDHIFVISGKISGVKQFVMCGFEVLEKMDAREAYLRFPEQRLRLLNDGEVTGNIIVDIDGSQHHLDNHSSFEKRIPNYVIGKENIAPTLPQDIEVGREQTLDALREILRKHGNSPFEIVGRWGTKLTENQVLGLRNWLLSIRSDQRAPALPN